MGNSWDAAEVEKAHIESLKERAIFLNAELVEAYRRQVDDWIRNEAVLRFLGKLPPIPEPAKAWAVHRRDDGGWVLEQTTGTRVTDQYKPRPFQQPATMVAVVGAQIADNIYEIGVGDNAPLGLVVRQDGSEFRKEGRKTPFGTMAYYERIG